MDIKEGKKKAKRKNGKKESENNQGMVLPAIIPIFPFGTFLLPLFVPCPPATDKKDECLFWGQPQG